MCPGGISIFFPSITDPRWSTTDSGHRRGCRTWNITFWNNVAIVHSPVINGPRIRFRVALQSYLLALHSPDQLILYPDHWRDWKITSFQHTHRFFFDRLTMDPEHDPLTHRWRYTVGCYAQIRPHVQPIHFAYVECRPVDAGNCKKQHIITYPLERNGR